MSNFSDNFSSEDFGNPKYTVTLNGDNYVFIKGEGGRFVLFSSDREIHENMPFKARAFAKLSKELGTEVEFLHNGASGIVKYTQGEIEFSSQSKWLQVLLEEAFDPDYKDKVRNNTKTWMQREYVKALFGKIVENLVLVEANGSYDNIFESEDAATAIVEAVNNMSDISDLDDPLAVAGKLIFELTADLQEPFNEDGAGYETYEEARTFVTHEAIRQYQKRNMRN